MKSRGTLAIICILLVSGLQVPGQEAGPDWGEVDYSVGFEADLGRAWVSPCASARACAPDDPTRGAEAASCGNGKIQVSPQGIEFSDGASETACGQALLNLPRLEGMQRAAFRFEQTRDVTAEAAGTPIPDLNATPFEGRQELVYYATNETLEAGQRVLLVPIQQRQVDGAAPPAEFFVGDSTGPEFVVAWLFSEETGSGGQRFINPGVGYAFQASVRDLDVSLHGSAGRLAGDAVQVEAQGSRDGIDVTDVTMTLPLPSWAPLGGLPVAGDRQVRIGFELPMDEIRSVTFDGTAVDLEGPLGPFETSEDALPAKVWLTFGPGEDPPSQIVVSGVVLESDPVDAPWLPVIGFMFPAVAAVVSRISTSKYAAEAAGPYRTTAMSLRFSWWLMMVTFVALLIAAAFIGWSKMAKIPMPMGHIMVYAGLGLVFLLFVVIWQMGGNFLYRSMRVDLTQRQAQAKELERSNQELERFAYVASHDLQEPLRKVSASTSMLRNRYGGKLDEGADKWIDYAVDGSKRMQALIQSLLNFSRVGRADMKWGRVDVQTIMEGVLDDLDARIQERGAKVTMTDLPTVQGDGVYIRQVFQNLVGNALKFVPEDRAPVVHVSAHREGSFWHFVVQDNGLGIPEEKQDQVFGMFTRLQRRDDYPGTGIGLAIVEKVVNLHGGKVWVESTGKMGSSFHLSLPA